MADRPILFSGPMVRAILDGRKTQTRRVLNPQPNILNGGLPMNNGRGSYSTKAGWKRYPFAVGDRLWVRETHAIHSAGGAVVDMIFYRATPDRPAFLKQVMPYVWRHDVKHTPYEGKWRAGMHMPRWASRLTLYVTDVRVQRLQEINRYDAIAEGLVRVASAPALAVDGGCDWGFEGDCRHGSPVSAYAGLWDSINGKRAGSAWSDNPWVVAVSFETHRANIDAMPALEAA